MRRNPKPVPAVQVVVVPPAAPTEAPKQNVQKKRFKRRFKKRWDRRDNKCPVTDKICRSEQNAKRYAENKKTVKLRAYKCQFCPAWHITHKKDKLKMH